MDNNELIDSSVLIPWTIVNKCIDTMDNCEHIHTSTAYDNANCCKEEFFPVSVFLGLVNTKSNVSILYTMKTDK